tara:strand:+ start:1647 stop:1838 length:192 start_codon:yes stop_codon:yes gene_type:complete
MQEGEIKMKCDKKFGKLGSGIPWVECGGELEINRFHDNTKSVLFSKTVCKKCNDERQGIIWQR